jgi:hypothetical protein
VGDVPAPQHFNFLFRAITRWTSWLKNYGAGLELNNTFSGANTLNGALSANGPITSQNDVLLTGLPGDTYPAQRFAGVVGTRKLLHDIDPQDTHGIKIHIYVTATGDIERSYNCSWNGTAWMPDYAATGYSYWKERLGTGFGWTLFGFSRTAETSWPDGSFVAISNPTQGVLSAVNVSTSNIGGNPASTVALSNSLRAGLWPKAWAHVSLGAVPVVVSGQNIGSVSYQSSNTKLRVTFPAGGGFLSGDTCSLGTYQDSSGTASGVMVVSLGGTETYIDLSAVFHDNTVLNLTTLTSGALNIMVFGKQ